MPLRDPSRQFLSAALVHLTFAGLLVALEPWDQVLTVRWNALLWLLLIGFVGLTTMGFVLHLFPPISRRLLPIGPVERAAFPIAEGAVVLGTLGAAVPLPWAIPWWVFPLGAFLYLLCVVILLARFVRMVRSPRLRTGEPTLRPGDMISVPLFLAAWVAAAAAGCLFVLSGVEYGPDFGWWLAAVHTFVLGHVVLLILAVSLRLVPRSLGADPPRAAVPILAGLGITGAVLVPLGMLVSDPAVPDLLEWFALPEAALAWGFFAVLSYLGLRARTPRRQLALHLLGVGFFVVGGGIGLAMLFTGDYTWVDAHALVNVLGFVGITIFLMWFGMIAPFQRLSHAWTARMLWSLASVWVVVVVTVATAAVTDPAPSAWLFGLIGGLFAAVALSLALGTLPVLYPTSLNPLPGVPIDRTRRWRDRWHRT